MKTAVLLVCLFCLCASAQSPDAVKYASRQVLLVSPEPGSEAVLPMVLTTDNQQQLIFVATSQIGDYLKRGAQPIRLEDILSALGASAESLSKVQAENARLKPKTNGSGKWQ